MSGRMDDGGWVMPDGGWMMHVIGKVGEMMVISYDYRRDVLDFYETGYA